MKLNWKDLKVLLPGTLVYIVGKLLGGGSEIILTSIGIVAFIGGVIALISVLMKGSNATHEQEITNIENKDKKKFNFLKIFFVWTTALSIILIILFTSIGSSGNTGTVIFSSVFLAILLSLIATFIHKWIFERKNPQVKN